MYRAAVSYRHAELAELEQRAALVEQPHDALLAVDVGRGRDADVEIASSPRDVANWPSCGRRRSTMFMSAMTLMRLTSGTAIDGREGQRLVAARRRCGCGPARCLPRARCGRRTRGRGRLLEDQVDDLHDRRVRVDGGARTDGGVFGLERRLHRLERPHRVVDEGGVLVRALDGLLDLVRRGDEQSHVEPGRRAECLPRLVVARVGDGDVDALRREPYRERDELPGHGFGQRGDCVFFRRQGPEVGELEAQLLGQDLGQAAGREQAELYQQLTEEPAGRLLLAERLVHLDFGDGTPLDEQRAQQRRPDLRYRRCVLDQRREHRLGRVGLGQRFRAGGDPLFQRGRELVECLLAAISVALRPPPVVATHGARVCPSRPCRRARLAHPWWSSHASPVCRAENIAPIPPAGNTKSDVIKTQCYSLTNAVSDETAVSGVFPAI